jgi:hypothetical protein
MDMLPVFTCTNPPTASSGTESLACKFSGSQVAPGPDSSLSQDICIKIRALKELSFLMQISDA